MINRPLSVLLMLGLGLAACGGGSKDPAPAAGTDGGVAPQAFSELLSIDQIAIYQAVKVSLVSGAETVTPNAPVIPKRPALVRVATKVPPRTKLNKLTAELRIKAPGVPDVILTNGPREVGLFQEGDLETSFRWELTADQVAPGASLSVEIRDPSGADPSGVRYPAAGELAMHVGDLAPKLRVKFVPIKYEADGSNRIPSMDKQTIEAYRDALYRMYPVTQVELSVRDDVMPWPLEVRGDGEGWGQLLDAVIETREDDQAADDVYYVGVFTPAENQRDYCQGGCILGIAPALGLGESVSLRTAMIVGYHSERQHGTLAQELAHAMGRAHAPCGGPTGIDKKFPYADASIGTWGWDIVEKQLISPDDRFDFMSYCNPVWVSDYTFGGIYDKLVEVEQSKRPEVGQPERQPMKTYHVDRNGTLRPGPTIRGGASSSSDQLILEGSQHEMVGSVRGSFRPLSNVGGGILVTPDEIPSATLKRARFGRVAGH